MMKTAVIGLALLALLALGFFVFVAPSPENRQADSSDTAQTVSTDGAAKPSAGTYALVPEESVIRWSVGKPLIPGYVNSGSIALSEGTLEVREDGGSGKFVVDMASISVSATPKKPGKEGALEGHLTGDRWFDTAKFPTAAVAIDSVTVGTAPSEYLLTGSLTLKGVTKPVAFPARITVSEDGRLVTEATLSIDRTVWGITSGSGSFFDDLGDNVIDDMINLDIRAVARGS